MSRGERNGVTQKTFLAAYAKCGILSQACRACDCSRASHYRWMKSERYQKLFKEAREEACERLEEEARRRAIDGWGEPVYQNGEKVGTKRKYSDACLIFLMKGAMPDKYKDRVAQEVSMDVNTTATIREVDDFYGTAERLGDATEADDSPDTGLD